MIKYLVYIFLLLIIINLSNQQCEFSCYFTSNDKNCTNKKILNANAIIQESKGIVNFTFDLLCNSNNYTIDLGYDKNICNLKNYMQSHSTYKFRKELNGKNRKEKCAKTGRVFFQDIQTGWYKIIIIDENDNYLYENCSYWKTSFVKQEINYKQDDSLYDSRNNGTELLFQIRNPILHSYPNFSLRFNCNNCNIKQDWYNLILDQHDDKKLILDPSDEKKQLNISCDLRKSSNSNGIADCKIFPVVPDSYSIDISFVGEPYKCPDKLYNIKKAFEFKNITVPSYDFKLLEEHSTNKNTEVFFGPVLGILSVSLAIIIILIIIKKSNNKKNKTEKKSDIFEIKIYGSCSDLLLLYARNSEEIMTILSSLRNIFIHQGIQVYDIYDPDRLKEIYENNYNWILNLTKIQNIKIIIFLTPAGINLSEMPQIQNSIDHLYPFAIQQLFNQMMKDREFCKKIFVVHFSNDLLNYTEYDSFSPYLRFRMPDDLFELLQRILSTEKPIRFGNKSNNEYNKLLENYEKFKKCQESV